MNKKILFTLFALLIILPTISLAQTADVDPQGSTSCVSIANNLRYRTTDAQTNGDVSSLQDFLQTNGYLKASPSGYMGLLTVKAVKGFQSDNGISPTGYVGPVTRAKIQSSSCSNTTTAVNTSTNATSNTQNTSNQNVTTLGTGCANGEMYSWVTGKLCSGLSALDDNNLSKDASIKQLVSSMRAQAELFYSSTNNSYMNVCSPLRTYSIATLASQAEAVSGQKSTCLDNATSWSLSVPLKSKPSTSYCADNTGYSGEGKSVNANGINSCGELKSTTNTQVSNDTKPFISIVNPNGGENLVINSPYTIKWNARNVEGDVAILLVNSNGTGCSIGTASAKSQEFTYTPVINSCLTGTGNYKLHITKWSLANGFDFGAEDFSDGYFSITSPSTNTSITNTSTTSTQPYFYINSMEPDATGAIAIVGKVYPGGVGFSTTPEVIRSNTISFDVQGLPPGLAMDKYVYQIENSNFGLIRFRGTPTQAGTFTVTVKFTYGNNYTTTRTFYLTVNPAGTVVSGIPQYTTVPSAPYTPPVPVPAIVSSGSTQTTTPVPCTPSNNSSTPISTTSTVGTGMGTVTITSPNGGECLTKGTSSTITWTTSSNIDKVTIFYLSSLGTIGTIASNIPNTGSYSWNVNVGNTINTQFKIEVLGYQTGMGSVSDTSDSLFTVN